MKTVTRDVRLHSVQGASRLGPINDIRRISMRVRFAAAVVFSCSLMGLALYRRATRWPARTCRSASRGEGAANGAQTKRLRPVR